MPDPIYSPGVAQFRLQFLQGNQKVENVFHCSSAVVWGDLHLREVANAIKNWWVGEMKDNSATNLQLVRVVAGELTVDGVQILETSGLPTAGTHNGQPMPNNVTCAVHWGTGRAGRSYQGRTYHLGLWAGQVDNNALVPAELASIQTKYDDLRTVLDNAVLACEFGVLSKYHNKLPRPEGVLTPITGVSLDAILDSQRRRLPGRGQ
jgi:hypothetical protein